MLSCRNSGKLLMPFTFNFKVKFRICAGLQLFQNSRSKKARFFCMLFYVNYNRYCAIEVQTNRQWPWTSFWRSNFWNFTAFAVTSKWLIYNKLFANNCTLTRDLKWSYSGQIFNVMGLHIQGQTFRILVFYSLTIERLFRQIVWHVSRHVYEELL